MKNQKHKYLYKKTLNNIEGSKYEKYTKTNMAK